MSKIKTFKELFESIEGRNLGETVSDKYYRRLRWVIKIY